MSRQRVVLLDDQATVRLGIRALLRDQPAVEVIHDSADVESAMHAVREQLPDVVVLDHSLFPIDGIKAIRRIHELRRRIGTVVLSRHRGAACVDEAIKAGAAAYVLKQSPPGELIKAISVAAGGGHYVDPNVRPRAHPPAPDLSDRELSVLRRAALGYSNRDIGGALGIVVKTVEQHKSNAMKKLGLKTRVQLIRYAVMHGWYDDV